jgi:hypothetical protein
MSGNRAMKQAMAGLALLALVAGVPARADAVVGQYRITAEPDTASQLVLRADGTFQYELESGALDEQAAGRWTRHGDVLALETMPRPVPPVFRLAPRSAPAPDAPTLRVTSPGGQGIGGVDFRIGFDTGGPVEDYTQESGWTMPPEEHRIPRWIELTEPIYGIVSPRYPIEDAKGGTLNFVIVPNDIGVVDFSGVTVDVLPGGLLVHRGRMQMKFIREPEGEKSEQ